MPVARGGMDDASMLSQQSAKLDRSCTDKVHSGVELALGNKDGGAVACSQEFHLEEVRRTIYVAL